MVNRSTYYKHCNSGQSRRAIENADISQKITAIYFAYNKCLGAYKINHILEREYGIRISLGRVYRLMRKLHLPKVMKQRRPRIKYVKNNGNMTNYLKQEFYPKNPNKVWCSDFTYIKVGGHFYYLCVVMDLFSRKIISWHLSNKHNEDLVIDTLKKAIKCRRINNGLMFHSDRGAEYTSVNFRRLLDSMNIVQSFSKKGYPYDNACMESFFKYLKQERTNRSVYHTQEELYLDVFDYIESFYNDKRPHGTLGNCTPNEYEGEYYKKAG